MHIKSLPLFILISSVKLFVVRYIYYSFILSEEHRTTSVNAIHFGKQNVIKTQETTYKITHVSARKTSNILTGIHGN